MREEQSTHRRDVLKKLGIAGVAGTGALGVTVGPAAANHSDCSNLPRTMYVYGYNDTEQEYLVKLNSGEGTKYAYTESNDDVVHDDDGLWTNYHGYIAGQKDAYCVDGSTIQMQIYGDMDIDFYDNFDDSVFGGMQIDGEGDYYVAMHLDEEPTEVNNTLEDSDETGVDSLGGYVAGSVSSISGTDDVDKVEVMGQIKEVRTRNVGADYIRIRYQT